MKKLLTLLLLTSRLLTGYSQVDSVHTEYEKGTVRDGYKVGIWEYSDSPGVMALKIDYTTARLLYLQKDTSTYVIRDGNKWISSKVDFQPRYIGSMNEFYDILSAETRGKYPRQARINGTVGTFHIIFEVDSVGSAGKYEVLNDIGDGCAEVIVEALKKIPDLWLAAQIGSRRFTSRFILPVTYSIVVDGRELKPKKNKKKKAEIPPGKILADYTMTAMSVSR